MLTRWLTLGLNAEEEDRFRRSTLGADTGQARTCLLLALAPVLGLAFNDFGMFGIAWRSFALAAVRLALGVHTIWLLRRLRGFTTYRAYDRAAFAWGLVVAVSATLIAATRPPGFVAHAIVAVLAVFIAVLGLPNRFTRQLTVAAAFTIGETLAIAPGLWKGHAASLTALVCLWLASAIGVACAWQLHSWRRREFLAREREHKAKRALRRSEHRVRLKLDSILSPQGDVANLGLADIVDADALQSMFQELNKLARIPMSIIDVEGEVLVGVGWQDICTRFHRVHPEACKRCLESDTELSTGIAPGQTRLYKCKNNMWDVATPIQVGGNHLGNLFIGQFFFDDELPDYHVFRSQAARYGFDEAEYLAALDAVPRLSRASVAAAMAFFIKLAAMLSDLSYSNVKLARSVVEREVLTKTLQEKTRHLEETDRRKNEFLAMLSHELRNPLAPIRNSIYLLERAPHGGDQAARARAIIRRQTDHLTRLVDDLLDVTRISRGKIELQRTRADARDVVRRACDDHRPLFSKQHLELRVEAPDPLWIDADETRVAQVIGNLLQNAAKFTGDGGTVAVSVGSAGGRAEIRVRDDGIGIASDLLPRVFEPFVQADRSLARSKGGLGLGLALVKGVVDLHGGSVQAHSEGTGRGAEFVVHLPLSPTGERPAPGATR